MKSKSTALAAIGAGLAMTILILDAKTALSAAQAGIDLCIRTVVPALFPFLLLSVLLTGNLGVSSIPLLRPFGKLCGVADGAEMILLTGFLGGYPAGAQCVAQAYEAGQLSDSSARRMLGFCNNAGPAFIFGMLSPLFSDSSVLWWLWGIHILSAILTAILLPAAGSEFAATRCGNAISVSEAMKRALVSMASICGWVISFRVVIEFCGRWFLWLFPDTVQICLIGILELTNGCALLSGLDLESTRFLYCALFLGLGGICVGMQTVSVTGTLGTGMYFPGKILQSCFSVLLATGAQNMIFGSNARTIVHPAWIIICVVIPAGMCLCLKYSKNSSSNFMFQGV